MNAAKIFNVATFQRDKFLLKTIDSIYDQADVINIALNSHKKKPKELIDKKIKLFITDNKIGDGYKFMQMPISDGYYFTIDDDLIYPSNYAEYMISKFHEYDCKKVITLHGRNFERFPVRSYYKGHKEAFRCLGEVKEDVRVQFGGTGVMMAHTDLLKLPLNYITEPNMADIWMGKYCMENGIDIICAKHSEGFLKYQNEVGEETIFARHRDSDALQTKIVNSLKL